jgi:SAM-dependent methyltransferase
MRWEPNRHQEIGRTDCPGGSDSPEKPGMQDAQRENGRQGPLPYKSQQYWDHVGQEWSDHAQERVWRAHSDAVNTKLFMKWLGPSSGRRLLKTDLFDEAVNEGVWDFLRSRADVVVGMDVSLTTLRRASSTQPDAAVVCADVRRLPFAGNSFDAVISNSTLDHFQELSDMAASLKEFSRIVRPGGGHLVLTIDNLANPVIALRNICRFSGFIDLVYFPTMSARPVGRIASGGCWKTQDYEHLPPRPFCTAPGYSGCMQVDGCTPTVRQICNPNLEIG